MSSPIDRARTALLRHRAALLERGAGGPEAEQELGEIDAALARIAAGTWGTCRDCGGPIGRQRLMALPEVRQCQSCRQRPQAAAP